MKDCRIWCKHNPVAGTACTPRKVDVIAMEEEMLVVKPTQCIKELAPDKHAKTTGPACFARYEIILTRVFKWNLSGLDNSGTGRIERLDELKK